MQTKTDKSGDITDVAFIQEALSALKKNAVEFPIKVEGTSTLPYMSLIQEIKPGEGGLILKLVRPLPHELMAGAEFRAVLPVEEQRFECLITFKERFGYLQYRFDYPAILTYADRRRVKRYPFRPRERAYVVGQDGGIPGMGVAGPLTNVGMGGLCVRLDRVLKLDDNMRIPPRLAAIERGKVFGRIRIQDLPHLPVLDCRAHVTHCTNKGGQVLLGMQFVGVTEEMTRTLTTCFEFREKMFRGGGKTGSSDAVAVGESVSRSRSITVDLIPEETADDPLIRLQRRTARLVLAWPSGKSREALEKRLKGIGYLRMEIGETLDQLLEILREGGPQSPVKLVLVDLGLVQGYDTQTDAVRYLEDCLEEHGSMPLVVVADATDPELVLSIGERTRVLAPANTDEHDEDVWTAALDALAGFRQ